MIPLKSLTLIQKLLGIADKKIWRLIDELKNKDAELLKVRKDYRKLAEKLENYKNMHELKHRPYTFDSDPR